MVTATAQAPIAQESSQEDGLQFNEWESRIVDALKGVRWAGLKMERDRHGALDVDFVPSMNFHLWLDYHPVEVVERLRNVASQLLHAARQIEGTPVPKLRLSSHPFDLVRTGVDENIELAVYNSESGEESLSKAAAFIETLVAVHSL